MVRYLFYTIGDLAYQSPLVPYAVISRYVHDFRFCITDVFLYV